ncbi:hypothetical protein DPM13_12780 [Paracoccus mutanolyticus]|uniref:CobW/HypB/UreG nucleotide-binding domain-containing protein n=1 Tax=Paracoccus mutanolyticus TaxID=1499308 RepID=A0ABM6WSK6_9RHOB|nr:hypothetical protein DPM13_12780 [Paracoccus mutanolyticus]
MAEQLPVFLLTGFLGAGKTTLLNRHPGPPFRHALVINEFGGFAVDQRLVAGRSADTILPAPAASAAHGSGLLDLERALACRNRAAGWHFGPRSCHRAFDRLGRAHRWPGRSRSRHGGKPRAAGRPPARAVVAKPARWCRCNTHGTSPTSSDARHFDAWAPCCAAEPASQPACDARQQFHAGLGSASMRPRFAALAAEPDLAAVRSRTIGLASSPDPAFRCNHRSASAVYPQAQG